MPIIKVPGHGNVKFPDSMSNEDIESAIKQNILKEPAQSSQGMPQEGALMRSLRAAQDNPVTDVILGAGDALKNTLSEGINLLTPSLTGGRIPRTKSSEGLAYEGGNIAGELASMLGPGAAIKFATRGIPALAGKVGAYGANAAGAGAYGALMNEGERAQQGGIGAGASLAADIALPHAFKLGGKIFNQFRPQKHAEEIVESLGKGRTLEETGQSLAEDIKNAYKKATTKGKELYTDIFKEVGDKHIYKPKENPFLTGGKGREKSNYEIQDKEIFSVDPDVKKLHAKFKANPTFQNAHKLQSEMGAYVRQAERGVLTPAEKSGLKTVSQARSAIKKDMNGFLKSTNPEVAKQYAKASDAWLTEVAPFTDEGKKLREIAKGKDTNPENIASIFNNPEPHIKKIVEDMGPEAKDKLLYTQLGKLKSALTPEKLAKEFEGLDKKGLGSYASSDLQRKMDILSRKIKARNIGTMGAGYLMGSHAIPGLSEAAGGIGGAVIAPGIAEKLGKRFGVGGAKLGAAHEGLGASLSSPLVKAMLAKYLSGGQ